MSKLVNYIMSFTTDDTYWRESQYAKENEWDEIVKMAKKKLKEDGVKAVRIKKVTIEEVFIMDKEEL